MRTDTMEVEILRDQRDIHILAGGYLWNHRKYQMLPDCDYVRFARRVGSPNLFIYKPRPHWRFVLAGWVIQPPNGVFVPLAAFDEPPGHGVRWPGVRELENMLRDGEEKMGEAVKSIFDDYYEEQAAKDETENSKRDMARHYKMHGLEWEAEAIRRGLIPHVSRREAGEAFDVIEDGLL